MAGSFSHVVVRKSKRGWRDRQSQDHTKIVSQNCASLVTGEALEKRKRKRSETLAPNPSLDTLNSLSEEFRPLFL